MTRWILALFVALAPAQLGASNELWNFQGTASACTPVDVSDDFADNLNDWTQDVGSFAIVTGDADCDGSGENCYARWTTNEVCTLEQYCKISADNYHTSPSNAGCIFRNGTSNKNSYHVITRDDGVVLWAMIAPPTTFNSIQSDGDLGTVNDFDYVTFCVYGTGDDTVVKGWLDSSDPGIPSDTCENNLGFGTPGITYTNNPGANAVDTGLTIGMHAFHNGSSQEVAIENWWGGDAQ